MNVAHFPHLGEVISPTADQYWQEAQLYRADADALPSGSRYIYPKLKLLRIAGRFGAIAYRMGWTPRALRQMREAA